MKKIWIFYTLPNVYLVLWLQWFSYGQLAAFLSYALLLLPFIPGVICGQRGNQKLWLKGNLLQLAVNMALTLLTMQWDIINSRGMSWNGITGIMYSLEFVIVVSVFSLFLQLFFVMPLSMQINWKKR